MGSIVPPLSTNLALTLKTDYCGNMIYENGQLSKILTDVGYITLANSTPTWVQAVAGGTLYAPGDTASTGTIPLNINSTRADFINAYPNNPAVKVLPDNFVLKTLYPNIYYKK